MKMWLIIPLVIALIIAIGAISPLLKSSKWPSIAATIVSSDITEIYHSPNSAITNQNNTLDYKVDIQYEYSIEGTAYTGNTLYAGLPNITGALLEAKAIQKQFPIEKNTQIYYTPKKPRQSALLIPTSNKKGNPLALYLIGLVVVIFIGAGIYIAPKI